jgi:hypothetical protein
VGYQNVDHNADNISSCLGSSKSLSIAIEHTFRWLNDEATPEGSSVVESTKHRVLNLGQDKHSTGLQEIKKAH